jgi:hypothetical protein
LKHQYAERSLSPKFPPSPKFRATLIRVKRLQRRCKNVKIDHGFKPTLWMIHTHQIVQRREHLCLTHLYLTAIHK